MSHPDQNLRHLAICVDITKNSLFPTGNKPQPITFTGSNIGGAPDVIVAEYWQDAEIGTRIPMGNWTSSINGAGDDENFRPKVFALGSTRGAGSRSVTGANEMTGFKKTFPLTRNVFMAWQMGIPAGYYFSGASAPETTGGASNLKMIWLFDHPHGNDLNDVIGRSRNSPSTWFVGGNHTASQHYTNSSVDWNVPMSFSTYRKCGANSYTNNGLSIARSAFNSGVYATTKNDEPMFTKRTKFTFTAQDDTLYTITLNGTLCSFTSGTNTTDTLIATGLRADINAKGATWGGTGAGAGGNIEIVPNIGTVPTVSTSANVTVIDSMDGYRYLETIWQGNEPQANTLHVYPYIYLAGGDNSGNYIMLANSATFDATMTRFVVVSHTTWNAGVSAAANPSLAVRDGMTHAHLFRDGLPVEVKSL